MFTGIIQTTATLDQLAAVGRGARLALTTNADWVSAVSVGDSIAVNGVCLTASHIVDTHIYFDVSEETRRRTNLCDVRIGDMLNLERSLRVDSLLDGHLVTGHVDDVAQITAITPLDNAWILEIEMAPHLMKYLAIKGSLCVDGISLTVTHVNQTRCTFSLVPHTWVQTNLQHRVVGDAVNTEIDIVARYCERLLNHPVMAPPVKGLEHANVR